MMGSMMTSCRPSVGDIWLAYVEFADHPGIGKVRPVVVIDVQMSACVVVAAKVTSRISSQGGSEERIPIVDWEACGLRKPSYVRLDQKLELAFENLLNDAPLGSLPKACVDTIAEKLRNVP